VIESKPFGHLFRLIAMSLLISAAPTGLSHASPPDIGLMEASKLKEGIGHWTVLDARPVADWRGERIPGALPFTWEDYIQARGTGNSYQWPTPQRLASALGTLGLTESTPVLVYGDLNRSWGGEGWVVWVLSWLGHKGPIRLLDGGIQAWKRQGLPVVSGGERGHPEPRTYTLNIRHELNARADELGDRGRPWVVIDTRSTLEWLTGRLPNAIHIPWTEFFTGRDRRPLNGTDLSRLLRGHGVDPRTPLVFYCAAGVRSAYVWTVLALAGSPTARNYSGGMSDWMEFTRRIPLGRGA